VLFTKQQKVFLNEEFMVSAPELGLESQSSGVVPGKSGVWEDSRSDGTSQDNVDQRELIPSPVVLRQDRSGFAEDRLWNRWRVHVTTRYGDNPKTLFTPGFNIM